MTDRSGFIRSVLVGAAAVAVLDALDSIVAYGAVLKLSPLVIYQFVASGLLGPAAYEGGGTTALLGVVVHCSVALSTAATFSLAAWRFPILLRYAAIAGAIHGMAVYGVMNLIVIPLSRIPPAPTPLPLLVNGLAGHVLFVGLPAALVARHYRRETSHVGRPVALSPEAPRA